MASEYAEKVLHVVFSEECVAHADVNVIVITLDIHLDNKRNLDEKR